MNSVKLLSLFCALFICLGCDNNSSEEISGQQIFQNRCSTCHGRDGGSEAGGVNLQESSLSEDEIEEVVREGRGQMPKFEGALSDEEIDEVVDYVKGLQE